MEDKNINIGDTIKIVNYGKLLSYKKDEFDYAFGEHGIYREYKVEELNGKIEDYIDCDCEKELIGQIFTVEKQEGYYVKTTDGNFFDLEQVEKI